MHRDADVIVVGAGLGGLTSAAALAHKGYKVMVFEAGVRAGGYCQSFTRKDYRFITSVHKLGGDVLKETLDAILGQLGGEPLPWHCFDQYLQIGPSFKVKNGDRNKAEILSEYFPHEAGNIARFFHDVDVVANELLYAMRMSGNPAQFDWKRIRNLIRYNQITFDRLLDGYFTDPQLKAAVYAWGVGDGAPYHAAVRAVIWLKINEGPAYLPVGGMETVVERLLELVKKNGGQVHMRSPVEKILVEDGRAAGVQVNGQTYLSRYVITNADLRRTYRDLVGPDHAPARILDKLLNRWQPTSSCFSVWLGLDCEIEELGWHGENVTYYRTFDRLIEMAGDLVRDGGVLPHDVGCGINTASSHDLLMTPPGRSEVTLGIPIASQYEHNWGIDETGSRGRAYRETKRRLADRLIDVAEDVMPGLRGHIQVMEAATPLTYERYGRHIGGAYLGFALTPQSLMDKDHPTSAGYIPGLFHCSKSMGGGACATMQEAMGTADRIMLADGRDDVWRFEETYATPIFEKHQAVPV